MWVKCAKCGRIDKTEMRLFSKIGESFCLKRHVGTKNTMKCVDCCDETGYAKLCRECCPTGHGTHGENK